MSANRTGTLIDPRNWDSQKYWYRQGNAIAWWDRYTKSWTAFRVDAVGNQVTPARYYANAGQLVADQDCLAQLGSIPAPDWVCEAAFHYNGTEL